jgi:hypothetical protein
VDPIAVPEAKDDISMDMRNLQSWRNQPHAVGVAAVISAVTERQSHLQQGQVND